MHYRLSNTAERKRVEREMGIPFKYPNLYQPRPIINGLEETIVPVVTMAEQQHITYAIWGILPEQYNEDWKVFQNVLNTLTLREDSMETNLWYTQAMWHRRCLILVSGYYTFRLQNGVMIPFYVSAASGGILSLAGIYNQLEDGFFTCALIIVNADTIVSKVQNIDSGMPLVIAQSMRQRWLYQYPDREKINKLLRQPQKVKLKAHQVSMDRYKSNNNPRLMEPFNYRDFPLKY